MKTLEERRVAGIRRALLKERARDLSERLDLPVIVTDLGYLATEVELEITRAADGAISPVKVLVGHEVTDLMLLDHNGVHGRCRQYNHVLRRLRDLAVKLTARAREGHVALVQGSPIVYTLATLTVLDDLVANREHAAIRDGAIRLKKLSEEIAFYTRFYEFFSAIVADAAALARVRRLARDVA